MSVLEVRDNLFYSLTVSDDVCALSCVKVDRGWLGSLCFFRISRIGLGNRLGIGNEMSQA